MHRIIAADGVTTDTAYANAYDADARMEGVRVAITLAADGSVRAAVHEVDEDAMGKWPEADRQAMLERIAELARDGDIEMCDHREVNAWITRN